MATMAERVSARGSNPAYQAYQILHLGFVLAPILAGADKFTNFLANWTIYLAPVVTDIVPLSPQAVMYVVGIVEIIAGLVVLAAPRIGGYIVALWLWGIILNLLLLQNYYDVALRDFGLSLGALALARLAESVER
jgi:uncharacterized membrane protein